MAIWDTLTSCIWFNPEYQRNTVSAMIGGILVCCFFFVLPQSHHPDPIHHHLTHIFMATLSPSCTQFFTGWWFLIDAMALYPHSMDAIHVILGILGTISLFMVNSVTQAQLNGDVGYSGGCMEARGARIWIFVGYVLGFAAIIAAIWVMVANFNSAGTMVDIPFFRACCANSISLPFENRWQDQQLARRQPAAAERLHFRVVVGLQIRAGR